MSRRFAQHLVSRRTEKTERGGIRWLGSAWRHAPRWHTAKQATEHNLDDHPLSTTLTEQCLPAASHPRPPAAHSRSSQKAGIASERGTVTDWNCKDMKHQANLTKPSRHGHDVEHWCSASGGMVRRRPLPLVSYLSEHGGNVNSVVNGDSECPHTWLPQLCEAPSWKYCNSTARRCERDTETRLRTTISSRT